MQPPDSVREIVRVEVPVATSSVSTTPEPTGSADPTTPTPMPTPAFTPAATLQPVVIVREHWRICHVTGIVATLLSSATEERVAAESGILVCPFTITAEQLEALQ